MRIYEPSLLKRFSRIQVCSAENARFLLRLAPSLNGRVDSNVRAAIDTRSYDFVASSRLPDTLLFLGSFRHFPNLDALRWFTEEVFPTILRERPSVMLHIVGSDPPQLCGILIRISTFTEPCPTSGNPFSALRCSYVLS